MDMDNPMNLMSIIPNTAKVLIEVSEETIQYEKASESKNQLPNST